jgi:hypothetical protein
MVPDGQGQLPIGQICKGPVGPPCAVTPKGDTARNQHSKPTVFILLLPFNRLDTLGPKLTPSNGVGRIGFSVSALDFCHLNKNQNKTGFRVCVATSLDSACVLRRRRLRDAEFL